MAFPLSEGLARDRDGFCLRPTLGTGGACLSERNCGISPRAHRRFQLSFRSEAVLSTLFEWLNRPDDSPTPRQRDTAVSHADIGHPAISPLDRTARQFGVMMLLIDVSSQKKAGSSAHENV